MIDRARTGDVVHSLGFEFPSVMGAEPLRNFSANGNVGTLGICRPLIQRGNPMEWIIVGMMIGFVALLVSSVEIGPPRQLIRVVDRDTESHIQYLRARQRWMD
jgi:hypothetical protein